MYERKKERDQGCSIAKRVTRATQGHNTAMKHESNNTYTLVSATWVNLWLPFVQGFMLGLGELVAHEMGFRLPRWFAHNPQNKVFPQARRRGVGHAVL